SSSAKLDSRSITSWPKVFFTGKSPYHSFDHWWAETLAQSLRECDRSSAELFSFTRANIVLDILRVSLYQDHNGKNLKVHVKHSQSTAFASAKRPRGKAELTQSTHSLNHWPRTWIVEERALECHELNVAQS